MWVHEIGNEYIKNLHQNLNDVNSKNIYRGCNGDKYFSCSFILEENKDYIKI